MADRDTPMMKQYMALKKQHPDCLLFFRLGDFYEMFGDDAREVSRELNLTLTTRDRGKPVEFQVPMCGVPFHSADSYMSKLVAKGYKIAICEQAEDPSKTRGLLERKVVRIITPGTVMESSMLDEGQANYIASVFIDKAGSAVCFADVSTGEICARSFPELDVTRALNELARFSPTEVVLNREASENQEIQLMLRERLHCASEVRDEFFGLKPATLVTCRQFNANNIDELSLGCEPQAIRAVGALLLYIKSARKGDMSHIRNLDLYADGKYMELDMHTIRNLELFTTISKNDKQGSLMGAMDTTRTPMGRRMLRTWVSMPLLSPAAINRRLDAVEVLYEDNVARNELSEALRNVCDMERVIGKIVYGSVGAREFVALKTSLAALPEIQGLLNPSYSHLLRDIKAMDCLEDVRAIIGECLMDDPYYSVTEGHIIREGYSAEVDRLRGLLDGSKSALTDIETKEKNRTGKKIRVGFNRVFGYFLEIPRSQSGDVPPDYIRKQTLANSERFVTEELKNLEEALLTGEDRLKELEYNLFKEMREKVSAQAERVQKTAALLAALDAVVSLASAAVNSNWTRPEITLDGKIDIRDGRHPVVEQVQRDTLFVPNDTYLDCDSSIVSIITGPNMAGKSTYMRQTALIVLMAQMGSFVPAKSAVISVTDRVFTRIGASDDLAGGRSTFMVEMSEVAEILQNASSRSLILLDEVGRGTSTYDGMAIARAVIEYCADKRRLGAKTMFSTHYHELSALEGTVPGVRNYSITAKKRGTELIFLRKIVPGGADESYGVEVASLAGVPISVVRRARTLLQELTEAAGDPAGKPSGDQPADENSQIAVNDSEVIRLLRDTDLNTMTPIEALNFVYELKKKVTL